MRNIGPVTKNLLILNLIAFLAVQVGEKYGYGSFTDMLSLHFLLAKDFYVFQLLTYQFVHADFIHLLFNMFALWMFGTVIEQSFGSRRFLIYYLLCGIGAGVTQELWQLGEYFISGMYQFEAVNTGGQIIPMADFLNQWSTVGASGAIYGILLAFGMIFPNQRIMLLIPPIPIKAKYFVAGYAALELYQGFAGSGGNTAHFAHLGGMLFGWLLILYWRRKYGGGGGRYGGGGSRSQGYRFFMQKVKTYFGFAPKAKMTPSGGAGFKDRQADYDYNARKKAEAEIVDRILEKIKKSGYESLTQEEKKQLFEYSNRN